MLSWKRLDTRVVMQVLEGLAMGRDVQECPANGDAQLYGSPDELPLPDAADTSRLPNAGHIKNKRSSQHETYVQPLKKPSLAAPVPVAPGTVVAHVQATPVALPSGLKAHSSTCEPRPRDSLSVGVANPTVASKPIEPTLAQAVSQLAQSLKDPQLQMLADKSHPPCATAAALPGTHKQVGFHMLKLCSSKPTAHVYLPPFFVQRLSSESCCHQFYTRLLGLGIFGLFISYWFVRIAECCATPQHSARELVQQISCPTPSTISTI